MPYLLPVGGAPHTRMVKKRIHPGGIQKKLFPVKLNLKIE
jgi:hypothetical protein